MKTGFFSDPGSRGYRAAEIEALKTLPIDRTEICSVVDQTSRGVTVVTTGGRVVSLDINHAKDLGLVH